MAKAARDGLLVNIPAPPMFFNEGTEEKRLIALMVWRRLIVGWVSRKSTYLLLIATSKIRRKFEG